MKSHTPDPSNKGPTIDGITYPERAKRNDLFDLPNVVGHEIGCEEDTHGERCGDVCVCVFVTEKVDLDKLAKHEQIPSRCGGCETDVIQVGDVELKYEERRDVYSRPIAGGLGTHSETGSIGSISGTFWDRADEKPMIVQSHHVIAGSLDESGSTTIGRDCYQPISTSTDAHIGEVYKSTNNDAESQRSDMCFVDPATAAGDGTVTPDAFGMGEILTIESPQLNVRYTRSSLYSGFSSGHCVGVDGSWEISGRMYHGLFSTNNQTISGDSGSFCGYVGPYGDVVGIGELVAGANESAQAIYVPFNKVADDNGLTSFEPLGSHTDHSLVSSSGWQPDSATSGFIDAFPRRIDYNSSAGEFEVRMHAANVGGSSRTCNIYINETDGTRIDDTEISLSAGETTSVTMTIPSSYNETRVIAFTDDTESNVASHATPDSWIPHQEFAVEADDYQPGWPDSEFPEPDDGGGGEPDPSGSLTAEGQTGQGEVFTVSEATANVDFLIRLQYNDNVVSSDTFNAGETITNHDITLDPQITETTAVDVWLQTTDGESLDAASVWYTIEGDDPPDDDPDDPDWDDPPDESDEISDPPENAYVTIYGEVDDMGQRDRLHVQFLLREAPDQ